MKIKLAVFFLLTMSLVNAQITSFATKESLGNDLSARENAGMATLNNKLYILAGYQSYTPKDFTEYNPATGELNKLADFPVSNYYNRILFAVQGKLYAFNGSVYVYDFGTNAWTLTSFSGPIVTSPDAGFVINDIIYITNRVGNGFYAYNTVTNTFTQKADYPGTANRRQAFAFDVNGKGYFGSGRTTGTDCGDPVCFTNNFYEYNPLTDTWATKANLPYSTAHASGIGYNGKGYAGLGEVTLGAGLGASKSTAWYEYNPIGDVWTAQQPIMNDPVTGEDYGRAGCSVSRIGNEIFIFGGVVQNNNVIHSDDLYKYNVGTNFWQIVDADMGKNRRNASGFYSNGKIYVGNGEDSEGLFDFWEYTIATDQWAEKAGFGQIGGHYSERACAELNGKGYFIGGYANSYFNSVPGNPIANYTDVLLEYDPVGNLWAEKAPFPGGKRTGMVNLSYNGKLYAGFGRSNVGGLANDFYEYDLATNSWTILTPAPAAGTHLSYFVLNDAAYIVAFLANNPTIVYKYNFSLNTWSTEASSIITGNGPAKGTNQAFTYDGKGYVVNGRETVVDQLSEYNPATGIWQHVLNLPFASNGGTSIVSPNGAYFGFGTDLAKTRNTNDWHELRFNAGVSDNVGVYQTITSNYCGTGVLGQNATSTIYDEQGDLFLTLKSGSMISNLCVEVNSIDLTQNFRTATANFGNGFLENGMFLNKSALFKNNGGIGVTDVLRLYYTTAELNKLVLDFNSLYNTNRTLADIKLVEWYVFNGNDSDPLNNITPNSYVLRNPILQSYGADKYFEISANVGSSIGGEIYAVLLTGDNLGINSLDKTKIRIYPNPTARVLNIQTQEKIIEIKIIDIAGRTTIVDFSSNKIDVSNLSSGIYFISIKTENGIFKEKFIKN